MAKINADEYVLYDIKELEPVLNVSRQTIIRYIKAGKLKAQKIGGRWKVSKDNLTNFINGD